MKIAELAREMEGRDRRKPASVYVRRQDTPLSRVISLPAVPRRAMSWPAGIRTIAAAARRRRTASSGFSSGDPSTSDGAQGSRRTFSVRLVTGGVGTQTLRGSQSPRLDTSKPMKTGRVFRRTARFPAPRYRNRGSDNVRYRRRLGQPPKPRDPHTPSHARALGPSSGFQRCWGVLRGRQGLGAEA